MALKKSEKRLLLVLAVFVAVFVINQVVSGGKKKNAVSKGKMASTIEKAIPSGQKGEIESAGTKEGKTNKIIYDSWGRDPFMIQRESPRQTSIATAAAAIDTSLQLKGIISKGRKVYALINDQIIGVGEEKDGIRIEKIEGNKVVCIKNGVRITLLLKG